MATDEDNFDIDIYGDGGEYQEEGQVDDQSSTTVRADSNTQDSGNVDYNQDQSFDEQNLPPPDTSLPKPPIPPGGNKRKDGPDDRPVDPGATSALFVGELSWWTTDDEIRGWAKESACEDELKEVTFHEQKVNGKSKGQVYVLFDSPQAATLVKHKIDQHSDSGKYKTKFTVSYTNPLQNPFKTLPKDGPARNQNRANSGNFSANNHQGSFNSNYRGRGRGNFNSGGNFNRGGFQGAPNNFNNQMGQGFQGGNMSGMQNFGGNYGGRGGFQGGRGGGMGMRGGRGGGMQPNMGMGMPMAGGMMPNMAMGMPMGGAMNMPGAFQGGYAPNFGYPQGAPAPDPGWTGGPNKRPRQE